MPRASALKNGKTKRGRKLVSEAAQISSVELTLDQIGGIPDEAVIEEAIRSLNQKDRTALGRVCQLLTKHLGSQTAARLWLATPCPGFEATPLDSVKNGHVNDLLTMLEAQWGPSPTYA